MFHELRVVVNHVKSIFNQVATNGKLDHDGLQVTMKKLDVDMSLEDTLDLFDLIDVQETNAISIKEFLVALTIGMVLAAIPVLSRRDVMSQRADIKKDNSYSNLNDVLNLIVSAYLIFDPEGKGFIEKKGIESMLEERHGKHKAGGNAMLNQQRWVDVKWDAEGTIDFAEFSRVFPSLVCHPGLTDQVDDVSDSDTLSSSSDSEADSDSASSVQSSSASDSSSPAKRMRFEENAPQLSTQSVPPTMNERDTPRYETHVSSTKPFSAPVHSHSHSVESSFARQRRNRFVRCEVRPEAQREDHTQRTQRFLNLLAHTPPAQRVAVEECQSVLTRWTTYINLNGVRVKAMIKCELVRHVNKQKIAREQFVYDQHPKWQGVTIPLLLMSGADHSNKYRLFVTKCTGMSLREFGIENLTEKHKSDVISVLSTFHRAGVCHGSVWPANVLISMSQDGSSFVFKFVGWGMSYDCDDAEKHAGEVRSLMSRMTPPWCE